VKIARDCNVPASDAGYVTHFEVLSSFLSTFEVQDAGGVAHQEYLIPAASRSAFNAAIDGSIEVIAEFRRVEPL
jgi:hypothetical protein